ncbi:hypothetical protein [Robertmurraya korlensis]|uniref:hypothetical protein n=1 Tax=Robertmurraya korlensis TaxID=519977 RepID=UPI0008264DDD|nr:hypothetical protein [Robertmurraya korlensis]
MLKKFNLYIALLFILPWLSLPLIGARTFKRFLPSSIFISLYLIIEGTIAQRRKWWWFPSNIKPNILNEFPLIFGPFFIGSIWILKYTYGKFKLYFIVNLIVDSLFTYGMMRGFRKMGYVTLVRLNSFQLSVIFLLKTMAMYGFQSLYEKYVTRIR